MTQNNLMVFIPPAEARKNFFFRGGDKAHTFEFGGKLVEDWQGRSEFDVLLERVKALKKPVASFVVQKETAADIELMKEACFRSGVTVSDFVNEWGVRVLLLTAAPEVTMLDLLHGRGRAGRPLSLSANDGAKKVKDFMGGFDLSSRENSVTVLECALLYGYPLHEAKRETRALVDAHCGKAAKRTRLGTRVA